MRTFASYCATLFSVAFLFALPLSAQTEVAVNHDHLQGRKLAASFDAQFFFVNNEYFTPQIEGYTLVGYTLRPTVAWDLMDDVSLVGGVHALAYGGKDRFHKVSPYFAVDWKINDRMYLRAGNLLGTQSHHLHDAVLNVESRFTDTPELGLQYTYLGKRVSGHAWLDWKRFIFLGDTVPEVFTAGLSAKVAPGPEQFSIPFSFVFNHVGGQISNYSARMQSLCNVNISPRYSFPGGYATLHCMLFHTMAGAGVRPFMDGWAASPEVLISPFDFLSIKAAWFRSRDFYSPIGNYLYSSVSNYKEDHYAANRSIGTLEADLNKQFRNGRFDLFARSFYDTFSHHFDYSYGVTFVLWPFTHNNERESTVIRDL